jgi:imidazolonepropionase-like amidohydrolase
MSKTYLAVPFLAAIAMAQPVVIRTTTLIDGRGHVLKNQEIVVDGGRISRIAGARQRPNIDLSGLTVMPGWIDTHVHLGWYFNQEGRYDPGGRNSKTTPQQGALYAAANAYATLMGGFTTVQCLGQPIEGDLRALVEAQAIPGPRILTSLRSINENTGDPERIRAYVRQMKADGADVVKLFATARSMPLAAKRRPWACAPWCMRTLRMEPERPSWPAAHPSSTERFWMTRLWN